MFSRDEKKLTYREDTRFPSISVERTFGKRTSWELTSLALHSTVQTFKMHGYHELISREPTSQELTFNEPGSKAPTLKEPTSTMLFWKEPTSNKRSSTIRRSKWRVPSV